MLPCVYFLYIFGVFVYLPVCLYVYLVVIRCYYLYVLPEMVNKDEYILTNVLFSVLTVK